MLYYTLNIAKFKLDKRKPEPAAPGEVNQMSIHEFYAALAAICGEDRCEGCVAREFCFTAPQSMTAEIIDRTIRQLMEQSSDICCGSDDCA